MLSISCKIQNENGEYISVLVLNHKYNPKYKCEYITYTNLDAPEANYIVPLIKENDTYYVDYSFSQEKLMEISKSLGIPVIKKLPNKLKMYKRNNKSKNEIEFPKIKEETIEINLPKKVQKVIDEEIVKIKENDMMEDIEKPRLLFIRLNDEHHMLFKIIDETEESYICERIKGKDIKNQKDYEIIQTTFNIPNYYKLEGESNITSANGMNTKIPKKLIISDKEEIHVLIVKYLDVFYAYFIIQKENKDSYDIEPTTFDFIKHRPYDLIIKTIDNNDDYRKFLSDYKIAYRKNTTMKMFKSVKQEEKLSVEDTQLINLTDDEDKISDISYDELPRRRAA